MKTKANSDSITPSSQERSPQYQVSFRDGTWGARIRERLQESGQTLQDYLNQLVIEDLCPSLRVHSSARR